MKNYYYLCIGALFAMTSCGVSSRSAQSATDTSKSIGSTKTDSTKEQIMAELNMPKSIKFGDSVILTFTVKNNSANVLRFCKWHTPFEPLMSKYLDVKNDKGEEMAYQGAMAKRIMPPPESSYITVKTKDSLSTKVNLLKAYAITGPGKYTVTYIGENMSGLKAINDVQFEYTK